MTFKAEDFYWCKYTSERATNISYKGKQYRLANGTVFGVCELRGQQDEIVFLDQSSLRLPRTECDKLMAKTKAYRGKVSFEQPVKAKAPVKPKLNVIVAKKTAPEPDDGREAKMLLAKAGVRLADLLTGGPKARARLVARIGRLTTDDAQGQRVLNWVKKRFYADSRFVQELNTLTLFKHTALKVSPVEPGPKPTITDVHHKVRLSEVEFPDFDDLADTDIPREFLDRVQSTGRVLRILVGKKINGAPHGLQVL